MSAPVRIALVGYGKMGAEIERLAAEPARGVAVTAAIDPASAGKKTAGGRPIAPAITRESLAGAEVALDFTHPSAVVDNVRALADLGVSLVVGTTGWHEREREVAALVERSGIGLVRSGNFSIGVHLFLALAAEAARLVDPLADYDVWVHEVHHRGKADSPSGTARMIAQKLLDGIDRKTKLVTERLDRPPAADEIHVSSTRGGSVPGTHVVALDSPADTIELSHVARNRSGFAAGAILAARFVRGRKGIHGMEEVLAHLRGGAA